MPQSAETLRARSSQAREATAEERAGSVATDTAGDLFAASRLDFSLNRLYYTGDSARAPLRIGVMVNGPFLELFIRKVLEDIRSCDFTQIVCVIHNRTPAPPPQAASSAVRFLRTVADGARRRQVLFRAYLKWLDSRYRAPPDPRALVDCSPLLAGVEWVDVSPCRTRHTDRFPRDAVERIKALDLDVALRFGFRILRGDALSIARHGVWSFHHGDSERYRGGPALLWELMERSAVSGAVLQRLEEALDAGPILCRAHLGSSPRLSVSANRFDVYWATQHFVIRKLWELQRFGPEHLEKRTVRPVKYLGQRTIYRTPTNTQIVGWLAPAIARAAVRRIKAGDDIMHWRIGLRRSEKPLYESPQSAAVFSWLRSPRGHFWADPFLFTRGEDVWMFFEDYDYRSRRGAIACGRICNGGLEDVRTVLATPHHLSYPHVFAHAGEVWMIPESAQARQVQLFRARRFPDDWVLERTLLQLRAVDCTTFQFEGRWWMFAAPTVVDSHSPLTLLFTAPELHGPWELHPASPICSDERWARSAGAVLVDNGRLIRPSQNCATAYGRSICFNVVKTLNEDAYEEEHGLELQPHTLQGMDGVHTYNRAGSWEAVDARAYAPRAQVL